LISKFWREVSAGDVGIGIKLIKIPESAECPCRRIHIASHSNCSLRPFLYCILYG
jgi:hypothetical protein